MCIVGICAYVCVCIHMEARSWYIVSSSIIAHLSLWDRAIQWTWISSNWPISPWGPLHSYPRARVTVCATMLCFTVKLLNGYWGSELSLSCLCSMYFTHKAISLASRIILLCEDFTIVFWYWFVKCSEQWERKKVSFV